MPPLPLLPLLPALPLLPLMNSKSLQKYAYITFCDFGALRCNVFLTFEGMSHTKRYVLAPFLDGACQKSFENLRNRLRRP